MQTDVKPVVLIILDGWGYSESDAFNAVSAADKPTWDRLCREYPHTLVRTSGAGVGLPGDQMGNSEVGHLNLGAGRVVYQEFTRVSRAVRTGSFFTNKTLTDAVDSARETGRAVHVMGLLSRGGVHSHEQHIHAMLRLAVERGIQKLYLHAFLDGRDTPPKSARASLEKIQELFAELGQGRVASVIGRYYAMDRDHRWSRIQAAYDLITQGSSEYRAENPLQALEMAYARGETDEFVKATSIVSEDGRGVGIADGDLVLFMNYRSDRARQITRPFIEDEFDGFERGYRPYLGGFVSLTEYSNAFDIPVAFPPERLKQVFGEYIAKLGLHQLRIAETEKYAHVTFFFNGGKEDPFEGEQRILVPSPQVATYDLQPEMNATQVTEHLIDAIESREYEVIICNYANADMVGHTGKMEAAVAAIESLDSALARVLKALWRVGGEALVTADHGNAEQMMDLDTGQPHTAHTNNPVPLIYVGREVASLEHGSLSDIAPTLLKIMGIPQPPEMTGHPLLRFVGEASV